MIPRKRYIEIHEIMVASECPCKNSNDYIIFPGLRSLSIPTSLIKADTDVHVCVCVHVGEIENVCE